VVTHTPDRLYGAPSQRQNANKHRREGVLKDPYARAKKARNDVA